MSPRGFEGAQGGGMAWACLEGPGVKAEDWNPRQGQRGPNGWRPWEPTLVRPECREEVAEQTVGQLQRP